jgi:hypothetical protein
MTCQVEADKPRLPRGWKRIGEAIYCAKCVANAYVLRATTLPIAKPVDHTWEEFRAAIREQWQLTSQCATWMVREYYARDVARAAQPKLPKMERVYLYPEARERFPQLPSNTVSALEQLVAAKYRKQRYGVVWTLEEQLQTLRYPQPFLVPGQAWSIEIENTARKDIILSVPLGGERWKLRLRGGGDFRRQRRDIEQIVRGEAVKGELQIYRKRAQGTDRAGQHGQQSSAIGTERGEFGQRVKYDVMVKLVCRYPRPAAVERSGTLFVRTDSDSLLVALNIKDERLWIYHADQLRRWTAEHMRNLNRWSDDQKAEQRPVPSFGARRSAAAVKFRNRIHSLHLEAAAQLVNYATRRRFAEIKYDDRDKGFVRRFDWSGLKGAIATKCNAAGILFTDASASGEVSAELPGPLEVVR